MHTPWPLATDQQGCFNARGESVPCETSGQDAARKKPDRVQAGRFEEDGDTVNDTATGLRWSRDANPFDFPYAWREAFDLIDAMNRNKTHGSCDWRLPSRRELFSVISHQHINPALPQDHPFRNVFHGYYWTATPCARLIDQAWYVHLGGARVYRGMQKGAYLVWPVTGPKRHPAPRTDRFRINERIVEDIRTGLWWTRMARTATPHVTWEEALDAPAELNQTKFGGRIDWRLPNIRELESLADLTRHSPALPEGHHFLNVQDGYWSSTTSVYEPRYAWVLYMQDGAVGVGFKPEATFSAWAVADGRGT
jgi:lysozyme family protein